MAGRVVGGGTFEISICSATLRAGKAQCKEDQDKFFVFSLTIAAIVYKYMHIYLLTALRIMVFQRGCWGFLQSYKYMHICLCAAVWWRYQVVLNMEVNGYG